MIPCIRVGKECEDDCKKAAWPMHLSLIIVVVLFYAPLFLNNDESCLNQVHRVRERMHQWVDGSRGGGGGGGERGERMLSSLECCHDSRRIKRGARVRVIESRLLSTGTSCVGILILLPAPCFGVTCVYPDSFGERDGTRDAFSEARFEDEYF